MHINYHLCPDYQMNAMIKPYNDCSACFSFTLTNLEPVSAVHDMKS